MSCKKWLRMTLGVCCFLKIHEKQQHINNHMNTNIALNNTFWRQGRWNCATKNKTTHGEFKKRQRRMLKKYKQDIFDCVWYRYYNRFVLVELKTIKNSHAQDKKSKNSTVIIIKSVYLQLTENLQTMYITSVIIQKTKIATNYKTTVI